MLDAGTDSADGLKSKEFLHPATCDVIKEITDAVAAIREGVGPAAVTAGDSTVVAWAVLSLYMERWANYLRKNGG